MRVVFENHVFAFVKNVVALHDWELPPLPSWEGGGAGGAHPAALSSAAAGSSGVPGLVMPQPMLAQMIPTASALADGSPDGEHATFSLSPDDDQWSANLFARGIASI